VKVVPAVLLPTLLEVIHHAAPPAAGEVAIQQRGWVAVAKKAAKLAEA